MRMYKNKNILENLELKLARTREEQAETVTQLEKDFNEEYKAFFESVFEKDTLGYKRFLGAYFVLDCIDGKTKPEALMSAIEKTISQIPLQSEKKQELTESIKKLLPYKDIISESISQEKNIKKDPDFPIIESLVTSWELGASDLAEITLQYKTGRNIIESTHFLSETKRGVVTKNFYELNNTRSDEKIKNFELDFQAEIENSPQIKKFPRVIQFLWRYYTKLKLKNKVESKTDRLKRMFKLAFLKLYRYKYSGIDIDTIIEKINSYSDLEDMLSLLVKYFEVLKQNPELAEKYSILDELEQTENLANEAEGNKEKEIQSDKHILETSNIVEAIEEGLKKSNIEDLLKEETDLVGENFIQRWTSSNAGILESREEQIKETEKEQEDEEQVSEDDIQTRFEKLRKSLFELEDKKRKCFAEGRYDDIDEINDELIVLWKKADKLKKLLGIGIDDETVAD